MNQSPLDLKFMNCAVPPKHVFLYGKIVKIVPFQIEKHKTSLKKIDIESINQIQFNEVSTTEDLEYHLRTSNTEIITFVISSKKNEILGFIYLYDIKMEEKSLEMNFHLFNDQDEILLDCCFLMIQYLFDILGYKKIILKTNEKDEKMIEKTLKIGFQFEIKSRNKLRKNKEFQNICSFSLIDKDWSKVKKNLFNKSSL